MDGLSAAQARRVALAASGFAQRRPTGAVDRRHLLREVRRLGLLQLDSVNVLARAHVMPPFSRLGPYPHGLIERVAYRDRLLFEYWAHEASLVPVELHPLLRWRMARGDAWGGMVRIARDEPERLAAILAQVAARGPVRVRDLDPERRANRGPWWDRGETKHALEYLFWVGALTTSSRVNFERAYDLPERVLPTAVLDAPTPSEDEAQRALLRIAAGALGVGTLADLADHFRIRVPEARPRVAELVEAGDLVPVAVEGWRDPAYLAPGARLPRRVDARALLAPFDPLVWFRPRVERLFGFTYRIEIYVPASQRRWGYYVLPFLLGDALVARVDLKADRAAGLLRVVAAHQEPAADPVAVAGELAAELALLAGWLGLDGVAVADRGDLATALRAAVPTPSGPRAGLLV